MPTNLNAKMGDWTPSFAEGTAPTPFRDDEASRLEIVLLALVILALVAHMGALIWLGIARRSKQPASPFDQRHGRPSRPCLWTEAFPDHPSGHDLFFLSGTEPIEETVNFVERLRKKSEEVATAVHRELVDIRRRISANSAPDPFHADVEVGIVLGTRDYGVDPLAYQGHGFRDAVPTGTDLPTEGCIRRHSSFFRGFEKVREISVV